MRQHSRSFVSVRSGQSLVEMALILPIVVIVITGLGEFTWIFWNFISIGNAAHEGVRHGAVGADYSAMESRVKSSMIGIGVTTVTIDVYKPDGSLYDSWTNGTTQLGAPYPPNGGVDPGAGNRYTVRVTARAPYEYLTILPNMVPGMSKLIEVRGTSTALLESSELTPVQ